MIASSAVVPESGSRSHSLFRSSARRMREIHAAGVTLRPNPLAFSSKSRFLIPISRCQDSGLEKSRPSSLGLRRIFQPKNASLGHKGGMEQQRTQLGQQERKTGSEQSATSGYKGYGRIGQQPAKVGSGDVYDKSHHSDDDDSNGLVRPNRLETHQPQAKAFSRIFSSQAAASGAFSTASTTGAKKFKSIQFQPNQMYHMDWPTMHLTFGTNRDPNEPELLDLQGYLTHALPVRNNE